MFSPDKWLANPSTEFYSHTIDQSLRFNDNDSAYLHRTVGTTGNRKTWTFSCWLKGASFAGSNVIWATSQLYDTLRYTSTGKFMLLLGNTSANLQTTAVFRDPSAWYNLVLAVDTTQSTSTDRVKFYVNGSQITSFSTATYPSLNYDTGYNHTSYTNAIGRRQSTSNLYWDSYLAEINMIDGTALTADSFGETKDGIWIPKAYSGSYGTNGFYLTFQGTGTATTSQGTTAQTNIGDDQSGTGNNFAVSGLASSDVVPDSPTNNFSTYNILVNTGQTGTYAEGNLAVTASSFWSTSVWRQGSIGVTGGAGGGKYYFEFVTTLQGSGQATGVAVQSSSAIDTVSHNDGVIYYNTAVKTGNTVTVSGISNNPASNVLRFAFDASNGKVWIGNSTGWYNSGDPANGTGESGTIANYDGSILVPVTNRSDTAGTHTFNFGQDSTFAGLKTSGSANGSDANGIGDFYYAVPSGDFLSLCSANLPEPDIIDGTEYFNTVLYTGNNSVQAITGVGFQPDFTWIKNRDQNDGNALTDSVRGVTKELLSNSSNSEITNADGLTAFGTDGFTVGDDVIYNTNSENYVSWNWKAGGTASTIAVDSISSGVPSIASSVSANTTAGFSIVSFTADGVTSGTVGHGLGVQPQLIIGATRNHSVPWYAQTPLTATNIVGIFSQADAFYNPGYNHWNDTHPTADVFSVGGYMADHADLTNPSTKIVYCFANVDGYSKVGSYIGGGSNFPFIYTGFRPAFVLTKRTDSTSWWGISDSKRSPFNEVANTLAANENYSESTLTSDMNVDFLSNGFKVRDTDAYYNASGGTYIYLAFAENPFKYSNAR